MGPDEVLQLLDDYGWPAQHTVLYDHTDRHALLKWDPPDDITRWEIVDLRDGHRIAEFGTDDSGRDAFRLFVRPPE
ncbi:MAG: hypothetical protein ACRDP6_35905 [Actinoallomurus sp.]